MAEFCQKCADNLGFPEADLTIQKLDVKHKHYCVALCEGCGMIFVVNLNDIEVIYRSEEPKVW